MEQEMQAQQEQMMQQEMVKQAGQLASAPMLDPSKNPEANDQLTQTFGGEEETGPEGQPGAPDDLA